MSNDQLIMLPELRKRVGVCQETIRKWQKAGKLPAPDVQISTKTKGWKISTLVESGIKLA